MIMVIFGVLLLLGALALWSLNIPILGKFPGLGRSLAALFAVFGILSLASTSYIYVGGDEVGHLRKIYSGGDLADGKIVATSGEKGFQATILPPGFHFSLFMNVLNSVEVLPMVEVPENHYGSIVTIDGEPLPEGAVMADPWPEASARQMLDAKYFLEHKGQKGQQATVLNPGKYPLNLYLYRVRISDGANETIYGRDGKTTRTAAAVNNQPATDTSTRVTNVPAGFVGVVKSNITEPGIQCREEQMVSSDGALRVNLVPRGCRGIWKETLGQGAYLLNRTAYEVTLVDTRVQAWEYKGGYRQRRISLSVDQQGKIAQTEDSSDIPTLDTYADKAIVLNVEGWQVPQEIRALVQVSPEKAPFVVAGVGGIQQIEDRILTPSLRSITRDVAGGEILFPRADDWVPAKGEKKTVGADGKVYQIRQTRIMDLIENRAVIEQIIEDRMRFEGAKAGVDIKEIRLSDSAIPPEFLTARQREQLAQQLQQSYIQEAAAQDQRIQTEQKRATADQQSMLVRAQIEVQVSEQKKIERGNLGQAEQSYLSALAQGQKEQAGVLGEDRVAMLQALEKVLGVLQAKPELVGLMGKLVPQVYVSGGSGELDGAAAILSGTKMFGGVAEKRD